MINHPIPQTCPCGHDRAHPLVTNHSDYTLWGWFWLYFGVTIMPKRVYFICSQCGQKFGQTTDPKEMEKYRFE